MVSRKVKTKSKQVRNLYAPGDRLHIVRGLNFGDATIRSVSKSGNITLEEDFFGWKRLVPINDWTADGYQKGYLGSVKGAPASFKKTND